MYPFDRLSELRSVARARAIEDLEFFATRVLSRRDASRAEELWVRVVAGEKVVSPSETFDWLFPELCLDNSSGERAA